MVITFLPNNFSNVKLSKILLTSPVFWGKIPRLFTDKKILFHILRFSFFESECNPVEIFCSSAPFTETTDFPPQFYNIYYIFLIDNVSHFNISVQHGLYHTLSSYLCENVTLFSKLHIHTLTVIIFTNKTLFSYTHCIDTRARIPLMHPSSDVLIWKSLKGLMSVFRSLYKNGPALHNRCRILLLTELTRYKGPKWPPVLNGRSSNLIINLII